MKLVIKAKQQLTKATETTPAVERHLAFTISRDVWLALAGSVYDREVESMNSENKASGGMVSAFLCAYGATPSKQEKAGFNPFPSDGGEFNGIAVDNWMEVTEERPRTATNLLPGRQRKWDEKAALLLAKGLDTQTVVTVLGKRPE